MDETCRRKWHSARLCRRRPNRSTIWAERTREIRPNDPGLPPIRTVLRCATGEPVDRRDGGALAERPAVKSRLLRARLQLRERLSRYFRQTKRASRTCTEFLANWTTTSTQGDADVLASEAHVRSAATASGAGHHAQTISIYRERCMSFPMHCANAACGDHGEVQQSEGVKRGVPLWWTRRDPGLKPSSIGSIQGLKMVLKRR